MAFTTEVIFFARVFFLFFANSPEFLLSLEFINLAQYVNE